MARTSRIVDIFIGSVFLLASALCACGQDAASQAKNFFENGQTRVKQGEYEAAIADFSKAIELDPKNPLAFAARGNARVNTGAVDEAIADFTQAIVFDPTRRVPYINRAVARIDKGDLDGAVVDYSKALSLDPKNALVYRNLGCVKQLKGDFQGAKADFQQAIALATDEAAYQRFYLALLGMQQKTLRVESDLKAASSRWKDGWKKSVGKFLTEEMNEEGLMEAVAQGTPKAVREQKCEGCYYAGVVRLSKGDKAGARDLFERSVATQLHTFPEFQFARAELAKIDKAK